MIGTVQDITLRKQIEEELKNSEERLKTILMSTAEAIYGIDLKGCCTFANAACVEMLGYSDAAELLRKNMHTLIHHSHVDGSPYEENECLICKALRKGKSTHVTDEVFWRADDGSFHVEYHSEPMMRNSELIGAVISFSDITQRRRVEERLLLSDRVFKNTSEAIIITKPNGDIIDVNPAFTEITGYSREAVIGQNPRVMKSGRQDKVFYEEMWKQLLTQGCWSGEIWDHKKSGEEYPKWLTINAVKDSDGLTSHYIGIFSDATKAKETEQQLQQLAFYDALTQLPNRTLFHEHLEQEVKNARRHGNKVAVLFMDLDGFKYINDTLGHAIGDLLLVEAGQRIRGCIREVDTLARLGGDEFTIILNDVTDMFGVEQVAGHIIDSFAEKFCIQGNEINIGASIGISIYPDNGTDHGTLTKNADTAMYKAKEAGRNTYRFFTNELHARIKRRMLLEKALRDSLEQETNGLEIHYQPKMDMRSAQIVGMEALLRWRHPDFGMISPEEIIPIAEETGLIIPLGEWVLRKACAQNVAWIKAGFRPQRVAVNLSSRQFEQNNIAGRIEAILQETGLAPDYLELEITEGIVMRQADEAVIKLRRLRELGIHLAVDDFGTGYSSLSYLRKFPIQSLKIDKSFIEDFRKNSDASAIVSTIISMANILDLTVVAEGVETKEQMEFLRKDGCDQMQGFYYSRPLPAKEFAALMGAEDRPQNVISFEDAKQEGPSSTQG